MPIVEVQDDYTMSNTLAALDARRLSAVSLNLAKESDSNTVVKVIRQSPQLRDADLYLFQEVGGRKRRQSVAEEIARKLGHHAYFDTSRANVYHQGLAIVSRYPITDRCSIPLKPCNLLFNSRHRFALGATVRTLWGDVRVWNVHLDTRINAKERIQQLQPVVEEAGRHGGPQVIGGDFNTNNMYWIGRVLPLPFGSRHSSEVRRHMKLHGFETPLRDGLNTFTPLRRHLDWLFLRGMNALEAAVVPVVFSDHNAVWVRAEL